MSRYTGYYGKIIVRAEFFDIIENGINLTATTDPVFILYNNLADEDRFDQGGNGSIIWEKWSFDRESGCWEFRVEYNERRQGCPHDNLIQFFIPYISKEIIDIYHFDEEDSPPYIPRRGMLSFCREQLEHREETIKEICEELKSLKGDHL